MYSCTRMCLSSDSCHRAHLLSRRRALYILIIALLCRTRSEKVISPVQALEDPPKPVIRAADVRRNWTDGVTFHVALAAQIDTIYQLDAFEGTFLDMGYCFEELLVTVEGPKNNITLRRDLFVEGTNGAAAKVVCAVNATLSRAARLLSKKCNHPVSSRLLLGSDFRSPMTEKVLDAVFGVPRRDTAIAPMVMWKCALNFMLGIFGYARSRYVLHLDADLLLTQGYGEDQKPYEHNVVNTALTIMNESPAVAAVMIPFCNDTRSAKMKEFSAVNAPSFQEGNVFSQPFKHGSSGSNHVQKWYFEKRGLPCGVSARQESGLYFRKEFPMPEWKANCFNSTKYPINHEVHNRDVPTGTGRACGETASAVSSQAFIMDASRFWSILPLRIPNLKAGWRAQIECLLEGTLKAGREQWRKATGSTVPVPLFVRLNGKTAGTCKTGLDRVYQPVCSSSITRKGFRLGYNCTTRERQLEYMLERQELKSSYFSCFKNGTYHRVVSDSKLASRDWP